MLVVITPYDPHLVNAIKQLPYAERRYDPSRKVWLVDPRHGREVANWIDTYFGESVMLPSVTQYKGKTITRLLEVRYIGACKKREDGSSVAFGLVGNDWGILIPEDVLRAYFDSPEAINDTSTTQLLTLYQILGIRKAASADDVKTAYRRMVKQWHPDVCRESNAQEMFLRIQEAYNLLGDPNKRARYDAGLALQAEYEKETKKQEKFDSTQYQAGYRSPLRCGMLMVEGIEKVGRLEVSKILAWEDIVRNGKTLVVSWPMGAKEPVEAWS